MQRAELTNVEIDRVHERRVTRLRKPEVEARQPTTTPDATDQQFLIPPRLDLGDVRSKCLSGPTARVIGLNISVESSSTLECEGKGVQHEGKSEVVDTRLSMCSPVSRPGGITRAHGPAMARTSSTVAHSSSPTPSSTSRTRKSSPTSHL